MSPVEREKIARLESQLVDCCEMGGFGDGALEALYQKSVLAQTRTHLHHLLCIFTASLILLALIHVYSFDRVLILCSVLIFFTFILQGVLILRPSSTKYVIYFTVQLLVLTCVCFFPSGHSSLLPCSLAIFVIYALLPLRLNWAIATCALLSLSQLVVFYFFAQPVAINQLLAGALFHIWSHFIGFYTYSTRERISRSALLRARNAFIAEERVNRENAKLTELLSTAVPSHLVHTVRQHIGKAHPTLYTEHYSQISVVYGRLIGLEEIFAECSAQDGARLLNELNSRINQIAKKCGCTRLHSDGILVVTGIPSITNDHTRSAITFACDVQSLIKSFCDATTAELGFRCGVETGSITGGAVGLTKWHYDVVGSSLEEAINIENSIKQCGVFITANAKRQIEGVFELEKCEGYWLVLPPKASTLPTSILFPNLRRFSLVTVPQAVNRLLQTISSTSDSLMKTNAMPGWRKKKHDKLAVVGEKFEDKATDEQSLIRCCTLRFRNSEMEAAFHMQLDQWFIPALAISIFFLVVYGVYHVLVLPRQIATLVLIVLALAAMFLVLLMLYVNYFQSFCQFITRTSLGHSLAILLILSLLFVCGIVNAFSCPQENDSRITECSVVHYSLLSCAFWMLTAAVFVRFPSLAMLSSLLVALLLYSLHPFVTHTNLYIGETGSDHDRWELLTGLLTLAALVFLQTRRNERVLRLDFMSRLKEMEEKSEAELIEAANQKMLLNALPVHIAQNFFTKSDLHHHICHSVGVAYIKVVLESEDGEEAINNLKNVISVFDQILLQHRGIEKIISCNKIYIVAVGVIPEASKNVHDTPSTIGDLLAELTQFALNVSAFGADHGISVNIGIDCGSVLTAVVNSERPSYQIWGKPCLRARTLMQNADCYGVMVSEEIYLALRPRNFNFDPRPLKVAPDLTAYVFDDCYPEETETRSVTLPADRISSPNQNPLEMFSSMNSSFSSEVYSIDVGIETDSEMEWITPEMLRYERRLVPSTSGLYASECTSTHTDNSEYERSKSPNHSSRRRRFRHGRYSSGWMSRSMTSETGRSYTDGTERLAAAASRVDRMLEELNAVADLDSKPECHPFPTALSTSTRSLRREMSSACHTEYDNAESEGICSDSEMLGNRLEQLKKALKAGDSRKKRRRLWKYTDNGNDADIDSLCSSLNASSIFGNLRWNSVHSIGYDNEYEIASREDLKELARGQMKALSRDIRNNFGDYQLATFSDIDA